MHKNHTNPQDKPWLDQANSLMWGCVRPGKCRQHCARQQNVQRRRRDKRLIQQERWEEIATLEDPHDRWRWS